MARPNEDRIKLWVKALRSGKYRQAQGVLRTTGPKPKYCCLGVACEVYAKAKGIKANWSHELFNGEIHGNSLPSRVMRWYGFDAVDPTLAERPWAGARSYGDHLVATSANDSLEWSFKRIATAIEKFYLKPAKKATKKVKR